MKVTDSPNHVESAVDAEDLASDVTGCVRSEKQNHWRNFFRPAQTLQRDEVNDLTKDLGGEIVGTHFINQGRVA